MRTRSDLCSSGICRRPRRSAQTRRELGSSGCSQPSDARKPLIARWPTLRRDGSLLTLSLILCCGASCSRSRQNRPRAGCVKGIAAQRAAKPTLDAPEHGTDAARSEQGAPLAVSTLALEFAPYFCGSLWPATGIGHRPAGRAAPRRTQSSPALSDRVLGRVAMARSQGPESPDATATARRAVAPGTAAGCCGAGTFGLSTHALSFLLRPTTPSGGRGVTGARH
jgi:hypothetical protein